VLTEHKKGAITVGTNELKLNKVAYCAGMDPEDYKAACFVSPESSHIDYQNYDKTYEAVVSGECDACVLPFERSRSGKVNHVMDLFYQGDLSIIKVFKWTSGDEVVRYAVLSRDENLSACEDGNRFMMIFTVLNVQGSLVKAINAISSNGFNIRFLHTRPLRTEEWGYYFYVECDGDDTSAEGQKMLADLNAVCETLKFVGRYPSK
jgi:prephenate dehydratase